MKQKRVYFDNNATTMIDPQVLEVMKSAYNQPLNSSAIHYFGQNASRLIQNAREDIKKSFNAENYELTFTSGGTESNNLALIGCTSDQIISSKTEHLAVYNIAQKKNALFVENDKNGIIDINNLEEILKNLDSKNFIVSVMLANNETGVIQDIKKIAQLTHQYGGLIHSDMVQAVGKIEIDLEDLNVDLVSISSHKLGGPQGVGALLYRRGIEINPIIYGSSQESGKRPGTVNVAGVIGFAKACALSSERIKKYEQIGILRDYLEKEITSQGAIVICQNVKRLPNTSCFSTLEIDNQTQLINFDLNNIAIGIGAACSSGSSKPSRTLQNIDIDEKIAQCAIRISLGIENTKEEIDQFITIWKKMINKNKK